VSKSGSDAWLNQFSEPVLEPDLAIVDPHHHLWTYDPPGAYLVPQLWGDTGSGHRVEQTVFVQCGAEPRRSGPDELRCVGETEFIVAQAAEAEEGPRDAARIRAIVAFADLKLGAQVDSVLEAHVEAGRGLVRGIRNNAAWDETGTVVTPYPEGQPHLYSDASFREGFERLAAFGFSYDAWNYHPQIPELTGLARAFPETTIVLDHFGGVLGVGAYADKRDEVFGQWKQDLAALAECPNVFAKLGGMAMPLNGFGWEKRRRPATSDEFVAVQGPYYDYAIEQFGPDRCMFESNFPVDKQSLSYRTLWNAFKKIAADYSDGEKAALFHGTAKRVYRLP
jgi:predicted TIM-barrel fold metal-dependent hydrolase